MRSHLILTLVFGISFTACDFGSEGNEVQIIDKYYVGWKDLESNRNIYTKESPEANTGQVIISNYVFAVGNDNRFIVAKSISGPNSGRIVYHIIDTQKDFNTNIDNNNYWNFSTEAEYNSKLDDLGILSIEFDKEYTQDPW